MKSTQLLLRTVAMSLLFAGALAQATQVTGTVTNKTTGKPAAGDTVVLVDVQAGMGEVAKATTDAHGHYALNKPGNSPYLVRVMHQGAGYFIGAPEGGGPGDISVYDVAAKVDGVGIDEDVLGMESANGQLQITERYILHNNATPPRTQWSPRSFQIVLPAEAVVAGVAVQRPGGLPTSVKLDPDGPKGHYSFNLPIQPDEGDKGTLFQIEYSVPYSGAKYTFKPEVTLPARTVWVVLPKSMTFAGAGFQSSPQDPGVQTFVAKNAVPGKAMEFTVSGSGSMPREAQGGAGGQQSADSRQPARRRPRRTHRHARPALEVQVVDSRRAGASHGGCRGLPPPQTGRIPVSSNHPGEPERSPSTKLHARSQQEHSFALRSEGRIVCA
jgi:hypothetical protein